MMREIPANADSFVREHLPNKASGGLAKLRLSSSDVGRVLVRFDSASMSELTHGPVLLQVTLASSAAGWGPAGRKIAVHRMTEAWTEEGATWRCSNDTNTSNASTDCTGAARWEMEADDERGHGNEHERGHQHGPGCGHEHGHEGAPWVATPTATATIRSGQTGTVTLDITRDVTALREGRAPNFGFVIKKLDDDAPGQLELASRETSTPPILRGPCADANGDGACDLADAGTDASTVDAATDSGADSSTAWIPASCDDSQPCTVEQCGPSGCTHVPAADGSTCGGSFCSGVAVCASGTCVAGSSGPPLSDGNECTIDSCDDVQGLVVHTPVADGTACVVDLCTVGAACAAGQCAGDCSSGHVCVTDSCDVAAGGCVHTPKPAETRRPRTATCATAARRVTAPAPSNLGRRRPSTTLSFARSMPACPPA